MQPSDTDPVLESDAFKMFCFKVLPCAKRFVHDWSGCPFAHHTEKARRRCPRAYEYAAVACPDIKQGAGCPRGERCGFAHNVFEQWLHPDRYRTQMCNSGALCNRKSCFFAHSPEQLRFPTTPNIQPVAFQAGYAATPLAWQMSPPACIPPAAFQHEHASYSVLNDDALTAVSSSSSPVSSLNFDPQEWADGDGHVGAGNMALAGPGMAPSHGHGQMHPAAAAMALQQLQQQQQLQQLQQLDALAAMQHQQQEAQAQAKQQQQQRRRQGGRQAQQHQQQNKPRSMMDMAEAQLHSHSLHLPLAGGLVSTAGADALRTSLAAAAAAKVARNAGARPASDSAIQHLDQLSQMLAQLQLATEQGGQDDLSPKAAAAHLMAGGPGMPGPRMAGQQHGYPSGATHDALIQEAMMQQLQQAQIQRTAGHHQQRPGATKHMGLAGGHAGQAAPMRPQGPARMAGGNMAGMQGIHAGMLFDTTLLDRWCF